MSPFKVFLVLPERKTDGYISVQGHGEYNQGVQGAKIMNHVLLEEASVKAKTPIIPPVASNEFR